MTGSRVFFAASVSPARCRPDFWVSGIRPGPTPSGGLRRQDCARLDCMQRSEMIDLLEWIQLEVDRLYE